jgi:hypothetical protein
MSPDPILEPCPGCGAEPGEPCRWPCLSHVEEPEPLEITRTATGRYRVTNRAGQVLYRTSSAGAAIKARARLTRASYYRHQISH